MGSLVNSRAIVTRQICKWKSLSPSSSRALCSQLHECFFYYYSFYSILTKAIWMFFRLCYTDRRCDSICNSLAHVFIAITISKPLNVCTFLIISRTTLLNYQYSGPMSSPGPLSEKSVPPLFYSDLFFRQKYSSPKYAHTRWLRPCPAPAEGGPWLISMSNLNWFIVLTGRTVDVRLFNKLGLQYCDISAMDTSSSN